MVRIISCLMPPVQKIPPQKFPVPQLGDSPGFYCYLEKPTINLPRSIFNCISFFANFKKNSYFDLKKEYKDVPSSNFKIMPGYYWFLKGALKLKMSYY